MAVALPRLDNFLMYCVGSSEAETQLVLCIFWRIWRIWRVACVGLLFLQLSDRVLTTFANFLADLADLANRVRVSLYCRFVSGFSLHLCIF